jgi:hypothetical protein
LSGRVASPERLLGALLFRVPRPTARQLPNVDIPQTNAILVRCEAASVRPGGRRQMAAVAAAHPQSEFVRTARHGAVVPDTDHGADAATVTSVRRIGTGQPDAERGIGSDQKPNVEGGIGGECRVINRREKAAGSWWSGLKQRASTVRRIGETPEAIPNCPEFEGIMIGRSGFFRGKTFHSIVIVARLHFSKFYRGFKKLTIATEARSGKHCPRKHRMISEIISTPGGTPHSPS